MATTTMPHAGEIKFQYGEPQVFALKFLQAKGFDGSYGPRGMFTAADEGYGERKIWLDAEDASDIEREVRALGVRAGEPIRVTKIRMPRGGGHAFRIERAGGAPAQNESRENARTASVSRDQDDAPAWVTDNTEALLEKSVAMVRAHGPQVFRAPARDISPESPQAGAPCASNDRHSTPTAAHQLMGAFMAAIDAISEAQAYCDRKGLKVTFTSEDVRATAISAFIQAEKAILGARY